MRFEARHQELEVENVHSLIKESGTGGINGTIAGGLSDAELGIEPIVRTILHLCSSRNG
jgi:hypothetical protein